MLDEAYKKASFTSVLNSDETAVRAGANAGEVLVAKLKMDGMKDYKRNSGYTNGAVDLTWETVKFDYDRGTKFTVDSQDNAETAQLSFGRLAGEFERTQVAPEADAYTIAKLAKTNNITKEEVTSATALKTGENVLQALSDAMAKMDELEVPSEQRHLFITPTLLRKAQAVPNSVNAEILDQFASIQAVPSKRMYTSIDFVNDEANGDMKGGFKPTPTTGKAVHFMIVDKSAVIKCDKHLASNIITPDENQTADAYALKYRKYGTVHVYENKTAGVYCCSEK